MHRRAMLRRMGRSFAAVPLAFLSGGPGAWLRRPPTGWFAHLDDPALGGRADGSTVNDGAFLQALEDMPPEGGAVVLHAEGTWLFDSVDLAQVGRRNVTIEAIGATIRKAPTTVGHMFHDTAGTSDGLSVVGGVWEAGRDHFEPGQVSSPFHFNRGDDLTFVGATFRDGIEEGLKLYKPVGLRVEGCRFERFRNNGIQIHSAPVPGYTGSKPNRGPSDIVVTLSAFRDIDDGRDGWDGQGLSVGSADPGHPAHDVLVSECLFERCVRGIWSENNVAGGQARRVRFERNVVRESEFHGMGLVGVAGGGMRGNRLIDIGTMVPDPPRTASSEVAGIILSGSADVFGEDLVVEGNEIVDTRGPRALMQYGIIVKQQRRLTLRNNRVDGATIAALDVHTALDSVIEEPA